MRARVLLVLMLVPAAGCGGGSQSSTTSGGLTTSGGSTAPAADRGSLGDAIFAEAGKKPEVIAGPQAFTAETTGGRKGGPHCKGDNMAVTDSTRTQAEEVAECLVNKLRSRRGIRHLKTNGKLYSAAQRHAADMVLNHYFSHTSQGGTAPASRAKAAGYSEKGGSWQVGENIAWGSGTLSTPAAIVQAWMDSDGHRKNLLRRSFREAGLAIATGTPDPATGAGGTYVQVFGRK